MSRREPSPTRRDHGFTLVELLVVIAVISIIALMLLPVFGRARGGARSTKCMNNLSHVGNALNLYASDYREMYPVTADAASPTCRIGLDQKPEGLGVLVKRADGGYGLQIGQFFGPGF